MSVVAPSRTSKSKRRDEAAEALLGSHLGRFNTPILRRFATKRLQEIPISAIIPNPAQPRTEFDSATLDELARSIRLHGLQQPITVEQPDPDHEEYILTAGERRFRAFQRLADLPAEGGFDPVVFERISAIVQSISPDKRRVLALVENLVREDLSVRDLARGLHDLRADLSAMGAGGPASWADVAGAIGMDVSRVKKMAQLDGRETILAAVEAGILTQAQALVLRTVKDDDVATAMITRLPTGDVETTKRVVSYLRDEPDDEPADQRVAAAFRRATGLVAPSTTLGGSTATAEDVEPMTGDADPAQPSRRTPRRTPAAATVAEAVDVHVSGHRVGVMSMDYVIPGNLPLAGVMRQRRVSPDVFADALQRTCEVTGIWPVAPDVASTG